MPYECLVPHVLMKQVPNRPLSALHSRTNLWHSNKIGWCSFPRLAIIALHLQSVLVFYLDEIFTVKKETKAVAEFISNMSLSKSYPSHFCCIFQF